MAKTKLAKIHAILGRSHRTGRWRLSPKTSVIALLGSCRLDLREAQLDGEVSKMTATVILGGVTIVIPPGVEVRPSGLSLLGGASVDVPPFEDDEATTLIEIEWTSMFGRLRIGAEEEETEERVEEGQAPTGDHPADRGAAGTAADRTAAVGADDVQPEPAIGFDDLDQPTGDPEPEPAIGFDDLDQPTGDGETTPNRRADDPEPAAEADPESDDDGVDADPDPAADPESVTMGEPAEDEPGGEEPAPAAVGFDDL